MDMLSCRQMSVVFVLLLLMGSGGGSTAKKEQPTKNRRFSFMVSCGRGTGTAVYDYADHLEATLGEHRPLLLCVTAAAHAASSATPIPPGGAS